MMRWGDGECTDVKMQDTSRPIAMSESKDSVWGKGRCRDQKKQGECMVVGKHGRTCLQRRED